MRAPTPNGKSKTDKNRYPIRVIRNGAIAASVWKRQTSTGFEYLDFSLGRSWKLKSGEREGYSRNFFENNAEAIKDVIDQTCRFIRSWAAEQVAVPNSDPHEFQVTNERIAPRAPRKTETANETATAADPLEVRA